jgi:thiol-disulfide isomerase/thioredoxin
MRAISGTIALLLALMITGTSKAQNNKNVFFLNGYIANVKSGRIVLAYTALSGKIRIDTALVSDNRFCFTGEIQGPVSAILRDINSTRNSDDPNITEIFIEPGQLKIQVTAEHFKNAKLDGSVTQNELRKLQAKKLPLFTQLDTARSEMELSRLAAKKDTQDISLQHRYQNARKNFSQLREQLKYEDYRYIANSPNSYLSGNLLNYHLTDITFDSLRLLFNSLAPNVQGGQDGVKISEYIQLKISSSPGSPAPDFLTKDINGDNIALSNFKGKSYVLLDFWGSWCVPCRKNNPELIKLFQKYKSKGFDIIGIAHDDENVQSWKKAVTEDGIGIWHHVLRGFDLKKIAAGEKNANDIVEKYGINSFPTQILVDRDGMIVSRLEGGNIGKLRQKLEEIFDK